MIILPEVLTSEELATIREYLEAAEFEDGKLTAFGGAKEVKDNEQLKREGPEAGDFELLLMGALARHELFQTWVYPARTSQPLVNRYAKGMSYGTHVDHAVALAGQAMRRDISITLFLSDPESYQGGELVVEAPGGPKQVKLPAGDAFAYTTNALHHVNEVTEGERLAAVFWVQSLVPDDQLRQSLFELVAATRSLQDQGVSRDEVTLLSKVHQNLLRKFART